MKRQQQDRSDRLKGLRVALGPCFDSDYAQKRDLKNLITNHGASFTYIVNAETTHLLSTEEEVRAQPLKIRTARKYKVLIVSRDWLLESTIGKEGAAPPLERKEGWRYALDPLDKIEQFNLRSLPAARSYVLRFMREGLTSIAALQLQLSSTQQPQQQQQQQKKALTIDLSADDQKYEEEVEEGWKEVLNRRQRQNKEQRQKEMEAKQRLALKKAKRAKARALNDEAQRREDLRRFKQEIKEKDRLQRREERLQRLEERWRLELERRHQRWKAKSDVADEKRRAWEERQAERRRRIEEKERKRREWQESKEARERLKLEWQRKIEEWEEMRRQETGKKLFVGGWTFDDLTEEVLGSESLVLFTKKKRIDVIKEQIFEERFPYIVKWKGEQWDTLDSSASSSLQPEEPQNVSSSEGTNGEEKPQKKSKGNFFFIVFDTPEHAQECFAALNAFQSKAEICSAIKKRLLENGDSPLYAPQPTFYVRWPKKEPPTAISEEALITKQDNATNKKKDKKNKPTPDKKKDQQKKKNKKESKKTPKSDNTQEAPKEATETDKEDKKKKAEPNKGKKKAKKAKRLGISVEELIASLPGNKNSASATDSGRGRGSEGRGRGGRGGRGGMRGGRGGGATRGGAGTRGRGRGRGRGMRGA